MRNPNEIVADALAKIQASPDLPELEQVKAVYLGKSGQLTELLKSLGAMPAEARKTAGARINEAKQAVETALRTRRDALQQAELDRQLAAETLDVTLPGRGLGSGGLHPVSRTLARIQALFHSIGFQVATGPEIETDFYNFTALNIPQNHPARAMHDTFYLQGGELLRTHTSPVQVRYMQTHQPPLRIIAPGRVYPFLYTCANSRDFLRRFSLGSPNLFTGSHGQTFSAFGATASDDGLPAFCTHTHQETMGTLAFCIAGLKCLFTHCAYSFSVLRQARPTSPGHRKITALSPQLFRCAGVQGIEVMRDIDKGVSVARGTNLSFTLLKFFILITVPLSCQTILSGSQKMRFQRRRTL